MDTKAEVGFSKQARAPFPPSGALKTLPHSIEAERGVLGGLLLDNHAHHTMADLQLQWEDFYKLGHQHIFRVVTSLIAKGNPADIITVTEALRSDELEKCGGASYLSGLVELEFSSANVPSYGRIVKEKSVLRKFIQTSMELVKQANEGVDEQEGFLDTIEKEIFSITSQKQTNAFSSLKEILLSNFDQIEKNKTKDHSGMSSGFTDLDKLTTGWQPGQLIIVAARPGMGKTSFMLNLGLNCTIENQKPVGIFSMEMEKSELGMRLLSMESRVDSYRLKTGRLQDKDWKSLQQAAGKLAECPMFIDDTPALNIMEIRARCRRIQSSYGLGLVIVDYLQLMQGTGLARHNRSNREQEVAEISRGLKALAKELQVPVIAASQLNRSVDSRDNKRPRLSDLRESGAIEQDADLVLFIHRDEQYDPEGSEQKGVAEIIIGKHRSGQVGVVKLAWLSQYTSFANPTPDHE